MSIDVGQPTFDHSGCFQVSEPLREQVRRDAGKALGELSVARGSDQELTNYQQIPAVTYHIECPGQPAVLTVAPTHPHHPLDNFNFT